MAAGPRVWQGGAAQAGQLTDVAIGEREACSTRMMSTPDWCRACDTSELGTELARGQVGRRARIQRPAPGMTAPRPIVLPRHVDQDTALAQGWVSNSTTTVVSRRDGCVAGQAGHGGAGPARSGLNRIKLGRVDRAGLNRRDERKREVKRVREGVRDCNALPSIKRPLYCS